MTYDRIIHHSIIHYSLLENLEMDAKVFGLFGDLILEATVYQNGELERGRKMYQCTIKSSETRKYFLLRAGRS